MQGHLPEKDNTLTEDSSYTLLSDNLGVTVKQTAAGVGGGIKTM